MKASRSLIVLAVAALSVLPSCSSGTGTVDEPSVSRSSAPTVTSTSPSSSEPSSASPEVTPRVESTPEPVPAQPTQPASPTATYMNPGEQYGEVCYSGTPDQWPNFVNPATGCGAVLNPNYVEPKPEPTFVECIYGGGSWTEQAFFSDGSYGFHPDCKALRDQQIAENPYTCPQTDARVPDPSYCTPEYLNAPVPEELTFQ